MSGSSLETVVRRLFVVSLLAYVALIPLSYGLATFSPREVRNPEKALALQRLVSAIPLVPDAVEEKLKRYVAGESVFADRIVRNAAYGLPILIATLCCLYLVYRIRTAVEITPAVPALLFRSAVGFALVQLIAYPIFTADFWLSIVWGRMAAAGVNPYYTGITAEALQGVPMRDWGELSTYGPGWTLVTAGITWLGRKQAVLDFLLLKLLLAGAWIATLHFVRRAATLRSGRHEAMAVALFGWLPISSFMTVAEAHNDVAMVLLMTVWLYSVLTARALRAPLALIGSALFKYATAPLVLVEVLAVFFVNRPPLRRYAAVVVPGLLVAAACFAVFARDLEFFAATNRLTNIVFWTPFTVISDATQMAGFGIGREVAKLLVFAAMSGIGLYYLLAFMRSRSRWDLVPIALTIQASVLFLGAGHVWPWYTLWLLPLAAIAWDRAIGWAVLAFAVTAPILNFHWLLPVDPRVKPYLGLATYGFALVLTLVAAWWLGDRREMQASTRVSASKAEPAGAQ